MRVSHVISGECHVTYLCNHQPSSTCVKLLCIMVLISDFVLMTDCANVV